MPLNSFRMDAGHQKPKLFRNLKLSAPLHSQPPGRKEELETEIMIIRAYVIKCVKIPRALGEDSFWVGEHIYMTGGWCTPTPEGHKHPRPFRSLLSASHLPIHSHPLFYFL